METPVLIINTKTYENGSGESVKELAYTAEEKASINNASISLAVQNADIHRIAQKVDTPVLAQHADPITYGRNTGHDLVETLAYNGASGVIINHSEDKEALEDIEAIIVRCKEAGLTTIVCAENLSLAQSIASFSPDYIAYEPEELIGGDTSVSEAKPEVLGNVVDEVGDQVPVLAGAGVKDSKDVEAALELGADGVLVASGVVKNDNPGDAIEELIEPF